MSPLSSDLFRRAGSAPRRQTLSIMLVLLSVGCAEEVAMPNENAGNSAPAASGSADAKAGKSGEPPPVAFSEADFIESDESRDPYREYSSVFIRPVDDVSREIGRKVKASMFALDELKLVAIITRSNDRAMLVDPKGYGWILFTGDFVGRAELVSLGGSENQEIPVNWKVDRIRPDDIVFVREDTARPQIARTTRVLPLYPAGASHGGS